MAGPRCPDTRDCEVTALPSDTAGRLFICATPIGNLEDVTMRLLRVLNEVDLIAAEDTRQTRKLLARYDIHKPLISYHRHNEEPRQDELLEALLSGKNVALVSDAGMPGIADPGEVLVRAAVSSGITLVPIPGPVAAVTALAASGLPTLRFCFEGFLPRQRKERLAALNRLAGELRTMIFYESPHRITGMLEDLLDGLGDRRIVLARELTKVHEEFWRGTVSGALGRLKEQGARGEFTVVVEGAPEKRESTEPVVAGTLEERVSALAATGLTEMDALKQLARQTGRPKRELYQELLAARGKRPEKTE